MLHLKQLEMQVLLCADIQIYTYLESAEHGLQILQIQFYGN